MKLALITLLAVLAGEMLAHASRGVIVVGGTADGPRRTLVGDAVRDRAKEAGWTVAAPLPKPDTERLLTCKDPTLYACIPNSLAGTGIDHVFVIKVDSGTTDGGEPQLTLDATLIGIDPRALVANKKHCYHCADDELRAEASALVDSMISDMAQRSGRTVLDIKTVPAGARILFDGKEVGFTDTRFSIAPGKHQVTLEKAGHLTKTIDVDVGEGTTKALAETLVSSGVKEGPDPVTTRPSRTPTLLLVAGLVGIAGGVTLVVLDKDPGPNVDYRYLNSAPWGYALGGAGVVALGLSYYTWRASKKPITSPTVSIVPGGAVLGWSKSL